MRARVGERLLTNRGTMIPPPSFQLQIQHTSQPAPLCGGSHLGEQLRAEHTAHAIAVPRDGGQRMSKQAILLIAAMGGRAHKQDAKHTRPRPLLHAHARSDWTRLHPPPIITATAGGRCYSSPSLAAGRCECNSSASVANQPTLPAAEHGVPLLLTREAGDRAPAPCIAP